MRCANLQEVLDTLGIVAVALAADSLHFFNLAGLARSLNVLEVDVRILTKVDNASQEIVQTCTRPEESNVDVYTYTQSVCARTHVCIDV